MFFSYSTICFKHVSITSGIFKIIDLKTAIVIPVYRSTDTTNMFFLMVVRLAFVFLSPWTNSLCKRLNKEQTDTVQVVVVVDKKYQVEARA